MGAVEMVATERLESSGADRDLWWTLIWQAARHSIPLAHALALARAGGARLARADDGGFTLAPIIGPNGWSDAQTWQRFRSACLIPYRQVLQRLLADLRPAEGTAAPPGGPRDPVLWQLHVSEELAGGAPSSGQHSFPDGEGAWREYHRRVAAGELFCTKPVQVRGKLTFWAIPPGRVTAQEMIAAAVRSEQIWSVYQAGPPRGMRNPVFVLDDTRWVEWDRLWRPRVRPGDSVDRLPVSRPAGARSNSV